MSRLSSTYLLHLQLLVQNGFAVSKTQFNKDGEDSQWWNKIPPLLYFPSLVLLNFHSQQQNNYQGRYSVTFNHYTCFPWLVLESQRGACVYGKGNFEQQLCHISLSEKNTTEYTAYLLWYDRVKILWKVRRLRYMKIPLFILSLC